MFDFVTGLFKGGPVKLIVMAAMLSALIGFAMYYDTARFNAGFNAAKVEMFEENEKAVSDAVADARAGFVIVLNEEATKRLIAERDAQALRDTPQELRIEKVIEIIENAECVNTGDGYLGLLNSHIGTAPGGQHGSGGAGEGS